MFALWLMLVPALVGLSLAAPALYVLEEPLSRKVSAYKKYYIGGAGQRSKMLVNERAVDSYFRIPRRPAELLALSEPPPDVPPDAPRDYDAERGRKEYFRKQRVYDRQQLDSGGRNAGFKARFSKTNRKGAQHQRPRAAPLTRQRPPAEDGGGDERRDGKGYGKRDTVARDDAHPPRRDAADEPTHDAPDEGRDFTDTSNKAATESWAPLYRDPEVPLRRASPVPPAPVPGAGGYVHIGPSRRAALTIGADADAVHRLHTL